MSESTNFMVKRPGTLVIQSYSREEIAVRVGRGEIRRDWLARDEKSPTWSRIDEIFELQWPPEEPNQPPPSGAEAAVSGTSATGSFSEGAVAAMIPPPPLVRNEMSSLASGAAGAAAIRRYRDGYLVGRAVNGIGQTVKTLAVAVAALIGVAGLIAASQISVVFFLFGLVFAASVALPVYVLGVIVSAQGQMLKAGLDSAVHTSPFLNDGEKAAVMSLQ